jgi:short-subunit dehydrogenase
MLVNRNAQSVVISGASAGLGKALALQYAIPERSLGLLGRDKARLAEVAEACRDRGADVTTGAFDVLDSVATGSWMRAYDAAHPIDLLIVNAGAFTGHGANRLMETDDEIMTMLRTNLESATTTISAALPMLRQRRRGRIAIIGSLAALQPLADAPAYSASKAGLMSYGEALREWLIPDRVAVTLIYPGHIDTNQVARHVGALPMLISAKRAAAQIKSGLDRGRAFIAFPLTLLWLIRAGRLLPWRLRAALGSSMRFHVDKE